MIEHDTYTEYWLSVDGAYEADIAVVEYANGDSVVIASGDPGSSPNTLHEWIATLASDWAESGGDYAIYRIEHGHRYGDETDEGCECIQFETDHNPLWIMEGARR